MLRLHQPLPLRNKMKALVYTGTQCLEYRDEPEPQAVAGESLVDIEASGICGSDMHAWHGRESLSIR